MKIISSTTVKQARKETLNAVYSIEYTIMNNAILRVIASIYNLKKDENENDIYIGTISYENDVMNCSLPVRSEAVAYFEDFESCLSEIKTLEFPPKEKK